MQTGPAAHFTLQVSTRTMRAKVELYNQDLFSPSQVPGLFESANSVQTFQLVTSEGSARKCEQFPQP